MNVRDPSRPVGTMLAILRRAVRGWRRLFWRARLGSRLSLGENVLIGRRAYILSPNWVRLGDNVAVGSNFHVESDLTVGENVLISSRVGIVGNDHAFDIPDVPIFHAGRLPASHVIIEGDNLIGFGVVIVGSVRIGKGAIVGAGSVVTRDIPPWTVCAGVPARVLRRRFRAGSAKGGEK